MATQSRKRPERRRPKLDQPNPIDVHVGRRLRMRRKQMGFSQGSLGERIGLTFQQVQKYERGASRIAASRLWELSIVLDVPIQYFFDQLSEDTVLRTRAMIGQTPDGLSESQAAYEADPLAMPGAQELVQAYSLMPPLARRHLAGLATSMAEVLGGMVADDDAG